jgi:hypothetical protein
MCYCYKKLKQKKRGTNMYGKRWNLFTLWKAKWKAQYKEKNGKSFKKAVPDPEERKIIYTRELGKEGILSLS